MLIPGPDFTIEAVVQEDRYHEPLQYTELMDPDKWI